MGRGLPHCPSARRTVLVFKQYPHGSAVLVGCIAFASAARATVAPASNARRVIGSVIVPSVRSVGGRAAPRYHALAHPEEPDAMMTLTLAAVYLLPLGPAAEPGYPNPKLLVEPEELARSADKFRVLDVRAKANYDEGHVPGAVLALSGPWSKAVTEGTADAAF